MEKMLKEAQQEKARLIENRVSAQVQHCRVLIQHLGWKIHLKTICSTVIFHSNVHNICLE